jgi:hypothetical protein
LSALNQYEAALAWYERSASEDREPLTFLTGRARRLIELGRYEEALRDLDRARNEREIELATVDFLFPAMHAMLLRELGEHNRFREARDELCSVRDWWRQCCESEPSAIPAWVLQTRDGISSPGVLPWRAQLLICTDSLPSAHWHDFHERLAAEILASRSTADQRYETKYLRSLLHWNDEYPWREVPHDLTGGKRVYVFDMILDRIFLRHGCLRGRAVDCWVTNTPQGPAAVLAETFAESESPNAPIAPVGGAGPFAGRAGICLKNLATPTPAT